MSALFSALFLIKLLISTVIVLGGVFSTLLILSYYRSEFEAENIEDTWMCLAAGVALLIVGNESINVFELITGYHNTTLNFLPFCGSLMMFFAAFYLWYKYKI